MWHNISNIEQHTKQRDNLTGRPVVGGRAVLNLTVLTHFRSIKKVSNFSLCKETEKDGRNRNKITNIQPK